MIFVPRKKIITSLSRQRGNIVGFIDPSPPPPSNGQESALEYVLAELSNASPGGAGTPRLDMQWRPDGLRVFTCRQSEEISQNDVSPAWGIRGSPSDWSNLVNTADINNLRSIWWNADGTKLSRCIRIPSFNSNVAVFDQSATPFDLAVLGAATSKTFPVSPALAGGPADHVWSADGLTLWLHYNAVPDQIYEFSATVPFDASTIVTPQNQEFDFGPDANFGIKTFEFANDGTFLFAMDGQFLVSWDLPTPFDIGTATNFSTGPEVPAANLGIPRGLAARSDNTDLSVQGDQNQKRIAWLKIPGTPLDIDPDIDEYILSASGVPVTLAANNHITPYFNLAGTRVVWARQSTFQTFQYELTTPGDLSTMTGNFEGVQNWKFLSQFMLSISLSPDRTKAYKIRRSGGDDVLISADPFSAAALGDPAVTPYQLLNTENASFNFVTPVTPGAFVVAPNQQDVFIASKDAGDRSIRSFQMSVPGDASTLVAQTHVVDLNPTFATLILGMVYSPSGDKLFIMGDDSGTISIVQYDMSIAYDVRTAVDSGKSITITPAFTVNLSLFVWENPLGGFKLYTTYMDNDDINDIDLAFDLYDTIPPVDSDFNNVVLLLDFAGADGAQNISDLSNSAHNDEVFNQAGTLEVDTAIQYLGKNTLLLVPTSGVVTTGGSNNRVLFNSDVDWQFGTGDFTVELGVRFLDNSIRQNFISSFDTGAAEGWSLQWFTGNELVWVADAPILISAAWVPNVAQQYHLAVSRVSGTTRLFVDGVQFGSAADATDYVQVEGLALGVLTNNSNPNVFPVEGNIGAVRITKGVGRYAANFTPPTVFYPTS